MKWFVFAATLATLFATATPSYAAFIIYSDKSVSDYGNDNADVISSAFQVTQQFTLNQDATITSVMIGVWTLQSAHTTGLLSVTYKLGTTPFASDLGTANVSVSSTFVGIHSDPVNPYDVFKD